MVKCQICQKEFKSWYSLGPHVKTHGYNSKSYYDKYIHKTTSCCKICGNSTRFVCISVGYKLTCSNKCSGIYSKDKRKQTCLEKYGTENPAQNKEIRQKISNTVKSEECQARTKQTCLEKYGTDNQMKNKDIINKAVSTSRKNNSYSKGLYKRHQNDSKRSDEFEIQNNCIRISKLIKRYGQGWLSIKDKLNIIHNHNHTYISNDQLELVETYYRIQSKPELELFNFVKELCNDAKNKIRQIIKPYELDIYIPSLKLAIEYNGSWFHSIENGIPKDYHLNKSILCKNKGIRLIHIYDFENFEHQKQLLKNLILGQDNYPKDDFNKNNFLNIPEPVEYITNRGYHIYTAGKLKEVNN